MTKAQRELKETIENIHDESVIEKVRSFIMGILAQQEIERSGKLCKGQSEASGAAENKLGK
ncbi:MAG: hypothetical protein ACI4SZ_02505 [Lachnospiraceae bacterium]